MKNKRSLPENLSQFSVFYRLRSMKKTPYPKPLKTMAVLHTNIKSDNVMFVTQQHQPFRFILFDFGKAISASRVQSMMESWVSASFSSSVTQSFVSFFFIVLLLLKACQPVSPLWFLSFLLRTLEITLIFPSTEVINMWKVSCILPLPH